jgi:hypothetical protein
MGDRPWWGLVERGGGAVMGLGTLVGLVAIGIRTGRHPGDAWLIAAFAIFGIGLVVFLVGLIGQWVWGPTWVLHGLGQPAVHLRTKRGMPTATGDVVVEVEITLPNTKSNPIQYHVKSYDLGFPGPATLIHTAGQVAVNGVLRMAFSPVVGFSDAAPGFFGANVTYTIEYWHPGSTRRFNLAELCVLVIHDFGLGPGALPDAALHESWRADRRLTKAKA